MVFHLPQFPWLGLGIALSGVLAPAAAEMFVDRSGHAPTVLADPLFISHGESGAQPLALYQPRANDHAWLRVRPLTPFGAPARGAVVRTYPTP
ncbi:MAG: hypothetical protein ACFCBW_16765 [Candidatus Competibacterales bacterium]